MGLPANTGTDGWSTNRPLPKDGHERSHTNYVQGEGKGRREAAFPLTLPIERPGSTGLQFFRFADEVNFGANSASLDGGAF
jgi:hypothetical protein